MNNMQVQTFITFIGQSDGSQWLWTLVHTIQYGKGIYQNTCVRSEFTAWTWHRYPKHCRGLNRQPPTFSLRQCWLPQISFFRRFRLPRRPLLRSQKKIVLLRVVHLLTDNVADLVLNVALGLRLLSLEADGGWSMVVSAFLDKNRLL